MKIAGDVLGVRPSMLYSDDELAARRQEKEQQQEGQSVAEAAPGLSQAALNLAKTREIAAKMGEGGGL
jgi:hypothetical protein